MQAVKIIYKPCSKVLYRNQEKEKDVQTFNNQEHAKSPKFQDLTSSQLIPVDKLRSIQKQVDSIDIIGTYNSLHTTNQENQHTHAHTHTHGSFVHTHYVCLSFELLNLFTHTNLHYRIPERLHFVPR